MAENAEKPRLIKAYEYIQDHPGSSASEISAGIGMSWFTFYSLLTTMENNGYLLSEQGGRFYPFKNVNEEGKL